MLISICEITVNAGRREAPPEDVQALADSIAEIGLLHPITVDCEHTLIAGLHRLEAVKLLGWTAIECMVSDLTGLQAELAEIDENLVRGNLPVLEYGEILLRRKKIYESMHPETKNGISQAIAMNIAQGNNVNAPGAPTLKSFVSDTSEKTGASKRTIEENLQLARNLTPTAKKIIQNAGEKIKKKDMLKLSRLNPEQQEAAASQLAGKEIHSIDEYQAALAAPSQTAENIEAEEESSTPRSVPYKIGGKHFASLEESIADLKDPNKDCHYTLDAMLADIDGFVARFHHDFEWYTWPACTEFFSQLSQVQFEFVQERFDTITTAMKGVLHMMKKEMKK